MSLEHELIVPNEGLPFKIFLFEGSAGGYYRQKHWHRSIEIFAVYQGEMDFFIEDQGQNLQAGEFIIVNSNAVHAIDARQPNETLVLQIPLQAFEHDYTSEQFIWFMQDPKAEDPQIMWLLRDIYDTWQSREKGGTMHMMADFYAVLYHMVRDYRLEEVNDAYLRRNRNLNHLSAITSYMRENHTDELSLTQVARIFGYSPNYLSRMFQKYAGITFKSYLQSVRLEYALQEMEAGCSITEAALRSGFSGSRTLSRAFKQTYGMLPGEYMRKKQEHGTRKKSGQTADF